MKSTKKIRIMQIALVSVLLTVGVSGYGQPGGGGGQGLGGPPPSTGAPVDGPSVMLLAAIAVYAHRKLQVS